MVSLAILFSLFPLPGTLSYSPSSFLRIWSHLIYVFSRRISVCPWGQGLKLSCLLSYPRCPLYSPRLITRPQWTCLEWVRAQINEWLWILFIQKLTMPKAMEIWTKTNINWALVLPRCLISSVVQNLRKEVVSSAEIRGFGVSLSLLNTFKISEAVVVGIQSGLLFNPRL